MTFNHFNRRLHLYLALTLVPWFLMYAASSLVFSHPQLFQSADRQHDPYGERDWTRRFDRMSRRGLSPTAAEPERRAFVQRLLAENRLDCSFGASPVRDGKMDIWCYTFFRTTRLHYDLTSGRLQAEDRAFRLDYLLTGMHARGGFQQEGLLDDLWAVLVDLVCLGLLTWAASGIVMWWQAPKLRRWGAVALAAGVLSFVAFLLGL